MGKKASLWRQIHDPTSDLDALCRKAVEKLLDAQGDAERFSKEAERAASLMERLRLAGRHELALDVAGAGQRSTADLRLEEALAAFAVEDDARVQDLITLDEDVRGLFEPLLAGLTGRSARGRSGARKGVANALHEAGKAVRSSRDGKLAPARTALKATAPIWDDIWGAELSAAIEVSSGPSTKLSAALARFSESPRLRSRDDLLFKALVLAQGRRPDRLSLPPQLPASLIQRGRRAAFKPQVDTAQTPGEVSALVDQLGIEAFVPEDQGIAWLYSAFAQLQTNDEEARRRLDRAAEKGADLGEILRGRALLERPMMNGPSPKQAQRAAEAWMRLAKLFAAEPLGVALSAVAAHRAGVCALHQNNPSAALPHVALARKLTEKANAMRDPHRAQLELLEAQALSGSDGNAALRIVDAVLARDPKNVEAWVGKHELSPPGQRAEVLRRAFEATGEREFEVLLEAQGILIPRKIVPGKTTGADLADQLAKALLLDPTQDFATWFSPEIQAARDALPTGAQAAVDGAAIACLHSVGRTDEAHALLATSLGRSDTSASLKVALLGLSMTISEAPLPRELVAQVVAGLRFQEIQQLLEVALDAEDRESASRVVLSAAASTSGSELKALKRGLTRRGRGLCAKLEALERELKGDFPLHEFVHSGDLEELAEGEDLDLDTPGSPMAAMLEALGQALEDADLDELEAMMEHKRPATRSRPRRSASR